MWLIVKPVNGTTVSNTTAIVTTVIVFETADDERRSRSCDPTTTLRSRM
ncbi:MAG TPA: hypothetical protein VGO90_09930 [Chthoniobacteraceae bacterium]|nr:hypothetical protein [Chthoniobacteraceae bacterium]